MCNYSYGKQYSNIKYLKDQMNYQEFESCTFIECDFSDCLFAGLTLIDCTFVQCNFNGTKIAHTSLRTVYFKSCEMIDLNFSMCDKLIFEVHFKDCRLDFSQFYGLMLNASTFSECSMIAVDFMSVNASKIVFDNCDFYRAEFENANLSAANLSTSRNYTIDPEKTKIKKAVFSLENLSGLLCKHGLEIY